MNWRGGHRDHRSGDTPNQRKSKSAKSISKKVVVFEAKTKKSRSVLLDVRKNHGFPPETACRSKVDPFSLCLIGKHLIAASQANKNAGSGVGRRQLLDFLYDYCNSSVASYVTFP